MPSLQVKVFSFIGRWSVIEDEDFRVSRKTFVKQSDRSYFHKDLNAGIKRHLIIS